MSLTDPHKIVTYLDYLNKNINQAFFVYDLDRGKLAYVNGAFEQLWGRSLQELQVNFSALLGTIHGDDQAYVEQMAEQIAAGSEKKNTEFRILLPDATEKWICLTACLFTEEDKRRIVVGAVEDITKSKAYTFNLLKYNAKKDATLEILSHDLASPMNTLQSLADLIAKRTSGHNDPELTKLLQLMQDTCKRGVNLIRDFVAQEFLESSNVDLRKLRVDLVEKIGTVIDNYKIAQEGIHKTFHLKASSEHIYAAIDDMKFMQVINNLISNAIKFTRDGGIISTHIEDKADSVLITVEDNGVGIPKHLQEGLFEKFTKARREGLKGEKSTGLGMSIIKTIVEWHNGRIWFESAENKGSSFYIELPKE